MTVALNPKGLLLPVLRTEADVPPKGIMFNLPKLEPSLVLFSSEATETDTPAVEAEQEPNLYIGAAGNEGARVEVEIPPLEVAVDKLEAKMLLTLLVNIWLEVEF